MTVKVNQQVNSKPTANSSPPVTEWLQRKCACGGTSGPTGECLSCKRNRKLGGALQTKLLVNQPGDKYEQEADRVAEQVMHMPEPKLQRQMDEEEEEELLQTKPLVQRKLNGSGGSEPPPLVNDVLQARGQALDLSTRRFMESRFDYDFGKVRIHSNARAEESAKAVNARAYTVGQNVVFGNNQYAPHSRSGKQLLAHELAHTLQQAKSASHSIQRKVAYTFNSGERVTITGDTSIGSGSFVIIVNWDNETSVYGETIELDTGNPTGIAIEANKDDLISVDPYFIPVSETSNKTEEAPSVSGVDPKVASEYLQWPQLNKTGRVFATDAKLFPTANSSSTPVVTLKQKTLVYIERVSKHGWLYVTTATGQSGYLQDFGFHKQQPKTVFVNNINPSDPAADIYQIKSGDTALGVAQKLYSEYVRPGHDARYFIGVLAWANGRGTDKNKGIYHKDAKDVENWETNWFSDSSWEKVVVVKPRWIWVPTASFARDLEGKITDGSLTNGLWSRVKDVAMAIAGGAAFIAGIFAGALQSIWDLVTGLYELGKVLVKTIKSLVTGNIVSDVKELIETLSKIDVKDLVLKAFENLAKKWNQKDLLGRWYFRGKVIGYILAEILMLFFTGGATALKWAGRFGKFGAALAKSTTVTKFVKGTQQVIDKGGDAVRYAKQALKTKRVDKAADVGKTAEKGSDVGKATGKADDAARAGKASEKLPGTTVAEKSVELASGKHMVRVQQIGDKMQIWVCSLCERFLGKIDRALGKTSAKGPTKSLHTRLTALRNKVDDIEKWLASGKLDPKDLPSELNQVGAHLRDLSKKYPNFDELLDFRKLPVTPEFKRFIKYTETPGTHYPASSYSRGKHVKGKTNAQRQSNSVKGDSQYLSDFTDADITKLEKEGLALARKGQGRVVERGPNDYHVYVDLKRTVGYTNGKETSVMRVEITSGKEIHSHPRPASDL